MIWPSAPVRPFQKERVMPPPAGFGAAAAAGAVVAAGAAAAAGLVGSAAAGAAAGLVGSAAAGLAGAAVGAAVGAAAWPQAASTAPEPNTTAMRTNERRDVLFIPLPAFRLCLRLVPAFVPAYTAAPQGSCQAPAP